MWRVQFFLAPPCIILCCCLCHRGLWIPSLYSETSIGRGWLRCSFGFCKGFFVFLFISGIYQINLMISVRCFFFDNQILAHFRVSFTWLLKFDFTVCLCTMILCKQDTYIIHVQGAYIIHIHGTCILHIMIVHTRLGLSLFDDFLSITSCHVYH